MYGYLLALTLSFRLPKTSAVVADEFVGSVSVTYNPPERKEPERRKGGGSRLRLEAVPKPPESSGCILQPGSRIGLLPSLS